MDLFNALVVLFFEVCILLEAAGGALNNNLKQQLSNCYEGRLAQRSLACYRRGLRPHYLSQSYYYLCVVPGIPPVLCRCPYNLVFEESVQTCVPGYIKGANSAALLHTYRTKWSNSNRYDHRHTGNNGIAAQHVDPFENHVAISPWSEGRKRHRRATINDPHDESPLGNKPLNTHHKDPSSHRPSGNNEHLELQLHQLSPPHPDSKKTLFDDGNDVDFNSISDPQGSEQFRNGADDQWSIADPAKRRSEKYVGIEEEEQEKYDVQQKHDMFPVWAIALASLCFVILLMLIVLYLY